MGQSRIKDLEYNLIDSVYDFKGLWGRDSKCGLKIVEKGDKTIIIVTELYNDNPGSSITEYCAELANIICEDKKINKDKIVFISHIPEINSSLEFFDEEFDIVKFEKDGDTLVNPDWEHVQREDVEKMIE